MIREQFIAMKYTEVAYNKATGGIIQVITPYNAKTDKIEIMYVTLPPNGLVVGKTTKLSADDFVQFNLMSEANDYVQCPHTLALLSYAGMIIDQHGQILSQAIQRGHQMSNNNLGGGFTP